LLLTCETCNSNAGRKIDYQIKNQSDLIDFGKILTGHVSESEPSGSLLINDERYPITVQRKDKSTEIKIKAYDHEKINQLKDFMTGLSVNGNSHGFKFNITKTVKLDYRLLKIAFLKSGFLLITAWLGYRYAFDERLKIVREQISNPEDELLGTCFWIEPNKDTKFPLRSIISVSHPIPSFLVTYDYGAVILPNPYSPSDFYATIRKKWMRNQPVNLTGKIYDWPQKPILFLDTQHG